MPEHGQEDVDQGRVSRPYGKTSHAFGRAVALSLLILLIVLTELRIVFQR